MQCAGAGILTDSGVSVLLGGVVEVMVDWVMDLLCVRGELLSCLFSLLLLDELSLLTSFSSAGISSQYLNMHKEAHKEGMWRPMCYICPTFMSVKHQI